MRKPTQMEPLGQLLLKRAMIDEGQLEQAIEYQRNEDVRLCTALIRLKIMDEEELVEFLCRELSKPAVTLDEVEVDLEAAKLLPGEIAEKYLAIPFARQDARLHVAMADPSNLQEIDLIQFRTRCYLTVSVTKESEIRKALLAYYGIGDPDDPTFTFDTQQLRYQWEEEPETPEVDDAEASKLAKAPAVVKLVDQLLGKAIKKKASDIHIEPYEKFMRFRLRIDGVLYEVMRPPVTMKAAITNRVKILAKLDIAERRLPQGGRIKRRFGKGREMDFRVSIMPTHFGEKVVIRLLDKANLQLDMTKLGFEEMPLKHFKEAIYKPFGMVLVTGPTGSGKTTTLYSALSELNRSQVNISTAEDPIEFDLPGVNQVHMHEEIGLTFAAALREFLRQDPDIIMVGEIRDFETAEIAVKAALTGHLVLSTLHTNDAPQTVNRLLNMGVEPFLVASSVNLILAQRLVRKLCPECKVQVDPPVEALSALGVRMEEIGTFPVYEPKGCSACNMGFKGRVALYEVMPIGDPLRELILSGASALDLRREAVRLGMQTLRMAGINKLREGQTTVAEVAGTTVG